MAREAGPGTRSGLMGQTLEEASKVAVVDFDSIEQMRTWLTYGPTAALERFIAMLRTALLMGDRVVVDRNQVLDGMCFLALGPSGVRHVLGLASHARLPVTIAVEPPGPSAAGEKPQDAATIDHQIARVSRAGFASSAAYAV